MATTRSVPRRGTPAPRGAQIGIIHFSVAGLRALFSSPFEAPSSSGSHFWPDTANPMSAPRVRDYADNGLVLMPGALRGDMDVLEYHERRTALHYANQAGDMANGNDPLVLRRREGPMTLEKGFYELAAVLTDFQAGDDARVHCLVAEGSVQRIDNLLRHYGGHWVVKPDTAFFGDNVFPLSCQGNRVLRVEMKGMGSLFGDGGADTSPRCQITPMDGGAIVAEFSEQAWLVAPDGDGGWKQERQPEESASDHLESFIAACDSLLGLEGSGLDAYLRQHVRLSEARTHV